MGWKDRQYRRQDDVVLFPFIQWVNSGGSLEPRSDGGGFAMPTDQAAMLGANIPGNVRALHHRGGDQTEVIFTTALDAAVLSTRFCWVKDGQMVPGYETGARGKLQSLALVRDADGKTVGPVLLTFRGHAGKQFSAALKTHREAVRKVTAGKAPAYAFFGAYHAGEVQMVGSAQQSPITSIVLADGFDSDSAYVGDLALDSVDWDQVDAWNAAWERPGANGGSGNGHSPASGGDEKPKPRDPDAPASNAQWGVIRRLLAGLDYKGETNQDEALRQRGYDPKVLKMGQASELIDRLQAAAKNGK